MAIDTEDKRRSAGMQVLPVPDATIDQGDRQHVSRIYRGILAGVLVLFDVDTFEFISNIDQRLDIVGSIDQIVESNSEL